MNQVFKKIAQKLGVDKSIAYSSGARVVQAFTGVASIFFIARFLSGVEQGFYYTFGSIVAIQVFFELGLTGIITQYVAYEAAQLEWEDPTHLKGERKYMSRLAHLVRFSAKWYAVISAVLLVVLIGVGFVYFGLYAPSGSTDVWLMPWVLVSAGTVLNLFMSPFQSVLMGLDKVKEISKIRFYQQIMIPLSTWLGLAVGFKLYVVGIASLLSAVYCFIFAYRTDLWPILKNLWKEKITEKVSYKKEIFPYQWRIALSWVSGYFIFQLFTPVLFAYRGAVVAGQMGMTLAVLNGINAFSYSWINTKIPLFSKLVALKEYANLDRIFNKTMLQMGFICVLLLGIMFVGVAGLRFFDLPLGDRFLPVAPMLILMVALLMNILNGGYATYCRCHKKEPFLVQSIVVGGSCAVSTVVLGRLYGVEGMTIGYGVIILISLIWGYIIYKTKKRDWHSV